MELSQPVYCNLYKINHYLKILQFSSSILVLSKIRYLTSVIWWQGIGSRDCLR